MVILALEEVTLKSWRENNHEKTAKEYKRRNEISPEQLRHGFRSDGSDLGTDRASDGSDLGTDQASYGLALGLAKAQHVEQKPCTDSRSESGSASWASRRQDLQL